MPSFHRIFSFCVIIVLSINLVNSENHFLKIKENFKTELVIDQIQKQVEEINSEFKIKYFRAFLKLKEKGLDRVIVIDLPHNINILIYEKISKIEGVEYLEKVPNYDLFYTPNDFNSKLLWHLNKTGARDAWDIEKGGRNILIGLIDDGMDTAHPDLQPVLWKNPLEIKGNGIDDDNNGYVDDYFGWDAGDNDNDPSIVDTQLLAHGTHCAGIAGGATDNNLGISSVSFNVKIMPIKISSVNQSGLFNTYRALEYAIDNNVQIISMSWGGPVFSLTYETLFDVAHSRNIVCVAAAGNENDNVRNYPAAYNNVIAVGSTDSNDRKSIFSTYGTWIDVMAPGTDIYSTLPGDNYGYNSGTSMACPMVAGLCALMLSRNPTLTNDEVESCLKSSCDNINSLNLRYLDSIGSGRINVLQALLCVRPVTAIFNSSKTYVCTGDTVRFFDKSIPSATSRVWSFPGGTPSISTSLNPIVRYNSSGIYTVQLISTRSGQSDTMIKTSYITVGTPTVKFSGSQTIFNGDFGTITADLTGSPPWTIIYSDGLNNDTIKNIYSDQYYIIKQPNQNTVYKPILVSSGGNCIGTVLDSGVIKVTQDYASLCDSSLRFHLTFGGSGNDQIHEIAVANDTNIYVAGFTSSRGVGGDDAFVAKLNIRGRLVWYKTFGNNFVDLFYGMTIDNNENIYLSGSSHINSSSTDKMMLVVKVDKSGTLKWYKQLSGSTLEYMRSCVVSKVNPRIIYFEGPVISNSFGGEDFMVVKCDTSGNIIWSRKFGTSSFGDRPNCMIEDQNGDLIVAGSSNNENLIIKIDSTGALVFSKIYAASNGDMDGIWSSTRINSHLYFTGYSGDNNPSGTGSELIVIKTDLNGNRVWSRKYTTSTTRLTSSYSKITTINNKLFITWTLNVAANDVFIMELDTSGNVVNYSSVGDNNAQTVNGIAIASDETIFYAGVDNAGNSESMVGKVNCKLRNLCKTKATTLFMSNYNLSISNYTLLSGASNLTNYTGLGANSYSSLSTNISCLSPSKKVKLKCKLYADFEFDFACTGDSVEFRDRSIDSNRIITGWNWQMGDGATISGVGKFKYVYKNEGNYNVRLIVVSTKDNQNCADTIMRTYVSSDKLSIASMIAGKTICKGDSVQLPAPVLTCVRSKLRYFWTPSKGLNDSNLAQPYFSPKVTTSYNFKAIDNQGNFAEGWLTVFVNYSCCTSISRLSAEKETGCVGDSIQFINNSTYDTNSYYFKWNFIGANITSYVGFKPPKVVFKNSGIKKVSLELSDLCTNDTAEMDIYIRPIPLADAGPDTVLCRQDTIVIGASSLGRNTYQWMPISGLDNAKLAKPTLIVSSNGSFKVVVKDEFGCENSDSMNVSIVMNDFFISNDTSYCEGDSLSMFINDSGIYNWSTGESTKGIILNNPGIYWGQVTNDCVYRDSFTISENQNPTFSLGNDTGFCVGDSITIVSNASGTYQWNNGSTNNSIVVSNSGKYWLKTTLGLCQFIDSVNIQQYPTPQFSLGADKTICYDSIILKPNINLTNWIYDWNTNQNSNEIKTKSPGKYILRVTNKDLCEYSDTIDIKQGILPEITPFDSIYKCIGIHHTIELPNKDGQTYRWNDNTTGNKNVFITPGSYWVEANTECGDSLIYFKVLDSSCTCLTWIPNAFSPNSDSKNDGFKIVSQCNLIEFNMRIYSRWGELLFHSTNYLDAWDGKYKGTTVPLGMYLYVIEYRKDLPGFKEYQLLNGTLMLID